MVAGLRIARRLPAYETDQATSPSHPLKASSYGYGRRRVNDAGARAFDDHGLPRVLEEERLLPALVVAPEPAWDADGGGHDFPIATGLSRLTTSACHRALSSETRLRMGSTTSLSLFLGTASLLASSTSPRAPRAAS